MTREEFLTTKPAVTRHFQHYTPEQRADLAASHVVGPRRKQALGEYFYTNELEQGIAYPTAKEAKVGLHRASIQRALSEGKPVPPEVLADYPDLAKQAQRAETEHPLAREANAYLENVDRIKRLEKKQQGGEYISDIRWLADTARVLRDAFAKENRPGELFGDYLLRISGREQPIYPKSVPFAKDYPEIAKQAQAARAAPAEAAPTVPVLPGEG
jgi:hypothetical protein